MTQEEKQLLLKDLCARLPYKTFAQWHHKALNKFRDVKIMKISTYGKNIDDYYINVLCQPEPGVDYEASIVDIKPYLRSMSSMTEEEDRVYRILIVDTTLREPHKHIDYLNSIHIDYRGLVEKGLAIEVTEENNPYEQEEISNITKAFCKIFHISD